MYCHVCRKFQPTKIEPEVMLAGFVLDYKKCVFCGGELTK